MWAVVRGAGSEKGKNQPEMLRRTLEDIFFKTETKILLIRKKPFLQRTNDRVIRADVQTSPFLPQKFPRIERSAPKSQGLAEYRRESRDLQPSTSLRKSRNDGLI